MHLYVCVGGLVAWRRNPNLVLVVLQRRVWAPFCVVVCVVCVVVYVSPLMLETHSEVCS